MKPDAPTLHLAAAVRYEAPKIKGSRFLALATPCPDVDTALSLLAEARAEFSDARHHCWAWRGMNRDQFRYSDDGEPSGSAGRPILNVIQGRELCDTAVVVVRWFGGTKLGVGGLVRAYGGTAATALDQAEHVRLVPTVELALRLPYPLQGPLEGLLRREGYSPIRSSYDAEVHVWLSIPASEAPALKAALLELGGGRLQVT